MKTYGFLNIWREGNIIYLEEETFFNLLFKISIVIALIQTGFIFFTAEKIMASILAFILWILVYVFYLFKGELWRVDMENQILYKPSNQNFGYDITQTDKVYIFAAVETVQKTRSGIFVDTVEEQINYYFELKIYMNNVLMEIEVFDDYLKAKQLGEILAKVAQKPLFFKSEDTEYEILPTDLDTNIIDRIRNGIVEVDEEVLRGQELPFRKCDEGYCIEAEFGLGKYIRLIRFTDAIDVMAFLSIFMSPFFALFLWGMSMLLAGWGYFMNSLSKEVIITPTELKIKYFIFEEAIPLEQLEEIFLSPFENYDVFIASDFKVIQLNFEEEMYAEFFCEGLKKAIATLVV